MGVSCNRNPAIPEITANWTDSSYGRPLGEDDAELAALCPISAEPMDACLTTPLSGVQCPSLTTACLVGKSCE
jgi:hypothetical protein